MKNITVSQMFKPLGNIFRRFHITIFIIVLVGGLVIAVFTLMDVIRQSSDTSNFTPGTAQSAFDQSTIDRINALQTSDQSSSVITLPAGRINPFSE